jgi:hypothetical protein
MTYLSLTFLTSSRLLRGLLLALWCVGAVGCAGLPAQEMSNARQAIKAARDAGAEQVAPQKFNEARSLLEQAEASLQKGAYGEARRSAIAAKSKATEALGVAHSGEKETKEK